MKIKFRKILPLIILLLGILWLVIGSGMYNNQECKDIHIVITNPSVKLIDSKGVKQYLLKNYPEQIIGRPFKQINTYKIAQKILQHPYVSEVKVTHDQKGILLIRVTQAVPIVKIITGKGDIYLDAHGNIMSAKTGYSPYVLVANGKITHTLKLPINQKINLQSLDKQKNSAIFTIFAVAKFINKSLFWRNFITQIYLKDLKTVVLSPRFGNFIIILGDTNDLEQKFQNLHVFLQHIDKIGWNRYSAINIKYKNQIVCVKK